MKKIIFASIIILCYSIVYAQTNEITNIQVSQRADGSGLVDISFDLEGEANEYYIWIAASFNGGSTYSNIHHAYLSGDRGPISPGTNKQIVWKGYYSFPNQNTEEAMLRITASPSLVNTFGTPCPDMPTITYGEQTYNTIMIGDQCWLKENLNIGEMIDNSVDQTDNGVIEKYCYGNDPANCGIYGGLYTWDEAMQYVTTPGSQGICPPGWRIPSDEDWKILEGAVDNLNGVGSPVWDASGDRGFDAGKMLKSTNAWTSNGNGVDAFGFTVLPAGLRYSNGSYSFLGQQGYFWTDKHAFGSSNYRRYWQRIFSNNKNSIERSSGRSSSFDYRAAMSIRCIRD